MFLVLLISSIHIFRVPLVVVWLNYVHALILLLLVIIDILIIV